MMVVAELFRSVQGEGFLTGTPSTFVRVAGCNLRCWFCDTPYASWHPEGEKMSIDEIVDRVEALGEHHVVLTGGEPLLFQEMVALTTRLHDQGRHITIETAGTCYLPVACDLMSISPKLSNSAPTAEQDAYWSERHAQTRHAPEVIRRLTTEYLYQLKFVVDREEDCQEVERYLAEFPHVDRGRVMLMPQGVEPADLAQKTAWLRPYCEEHGLEFCARRQIEWFGFTRGT
jgi:7-carboxy-7-deazaguanine synthase